MPRLEDLSDTARQGHLNFPAMEHDDAPFAPLSKPLSEAKLALVTTAGLHLRGDAPFSSGDQTYRVIPSSSPASARTCVRKAKRRSCSSTSSNRTRTVSNAISTGFARRSMSSA